MKKLPNTYRHYFINHEHKDPVINPPGFPMESKEFCVFFMAKSCPQPDRFSRKTWWLATSKFGSFQQKKLDPFSDRPPPGFFRSSGVHLYGTLRLFRRYGAVGWMTW